MSPPGANPNAAERTRRGPPTEQPHAGPPLSGPVRVKPVRVTVDLGPNDYDTLRDFAHRERMTHTDVIRALVRLLDQPSVGEDVSKSTTLRNEGHHS